MPHVQQRQKKTTKKSNERIRPTMRMRRHHSASHVPIGCAFFALGPVTAILILAMYFAAHPDVAFGLAATIHRFAHAGRNAPPYPPYRTRAPLSSVPPSQTMPRTPAPQTHPRPAKAPKAASPAQTPIYWGRQRVGWEDERGIIHLDRKPA